MILWPFKAQWLLYVLPNLTFNNYTFCPQNKVMCFVLFSEPTAIISPYSINWLVFITEECVSWEVRTEFRPDEICGGQSGDGTKFMSEYFGFNPQLPSINPPYQCFPNIFFLADPLWLRKITTDPPTLAHKNIQCQDDRCPKVNIYISEKVLGRYEYRQVACVIIY